MTLLTDARLQQFYRATLWAEVKPQPATFQTDIISRWPILQPTAAP